MENKTMPKIDLTQVNTGTKMGYEDYHGDIYLNNELISTWSYDKRQGKYIACIYHPDFNNGRKKFYSDKPSQLIYLIQKRLIKIDTSLITNFKGELLTNKTPNP